ncbi:MAG: hypothetical protein JW966_09075 [Anaerolineae bacterium]|nr:hypothetical protein [Anaerolineae bacterium]
MGEPAYITIGSDGHVTLFWGDGTESQKYVIFRGPRAPQGPKLLAIIEDLKAWAEDNGYEVHVPMYDLEVPDDLEFELSQKETDTIDLDDVDDLLDDIYWAGDYDADIDQDIPPEY